MTTTRIVQIPPAASMPAPFIVVDGQGRVIQRGALLLEGEAPHAEVRTIAVAPGADVLIRWLGLPVGGAAQTRAAARWMLKDDLAALPDRTVVAVGAPGVADGARLTAAVSATLLEAWIDYLAALGVSVEAVVPDCLVLPEPQDDLTLATVAVGGDVALRGRGFAATVQADLVQAMAGDRSLAPVGDWDAALSALATVPLPVNLLSGVERTRQASSGGWRRVAALAAAVLISPLILAAAGAAHDQHEASRAREATLALIAEALPDAAKAADPIAEARRQLAAAPPPGGMAAASAALFAAVEGVEGAELDGMSSSAGQGLRATVSYPAFGDLDAMRTALNGSGLSLSDTSTVEDGGRVVSEIVLGGAS